MFILSKITFQVLTEGSILLACQTLLLSGVKNMKAGFNSLCAWARYLLFNALYLKLTPFVIHHYSVNHQHWHVFYLEAHTIKLETVKAEPLNNGCWFVNEQDYPAPCFAFQVSKHFFLKQTLKLLFVKYL